MTFGETVYFIEGEHKGKTGRYVGHYRDSGYLVPYVYMGEDTEGLNRAYEELKYNRFACDVSRPWDNEITTKKSVFKNIKKLKSELTVEEDLKAFIEKVDKDLDKS